MSLNRLDRGHINQYLCC